MAESMPNQQRTLNKLSTELRRQKIFVFKHRLSMQVGAQTRAKNVHATCTHVPTELPSLHATVAGWVAATSTEFFFFFLLLLFSGKGKGVTLPSRRRGEIQSPVGTLGTVEPVDLGTWGDASGSMHSLPDGSHH